MNTKPAPPEIQAFIDDVVALCAKHNVAITVTDCSGLILDYANGAMSYGASDVEFFEINSEGLK